MHVSDVGAVVALVVVVAVALDAVIGEVPNRVHPVVGMGWLTRRVLSLRPTSGEPAAEFGFGVMLVLAVAGVSAGTGWAVEQALRGFGARLAAFVPAPWNAVVTVAEVGAEALALSTLFAGKGLIDAGKRMRAALDVSLDAGRDALSHLCSRDPRDLGRAELCGATVESLAENASDSFVAPLLWYVAVALAGGSGLMAAATYRAVNTLDAMVGYRGKYEYVGKFAARFDDVLNWIPARVTALTLLVASAVCRLRVVQALYVGLEQHRATESPNAGWPMAVAAGALDVELTKRDCYVLGKGLRAPGPEAIADCERLVGVGFALFTMAAAAVAVGVGHG